MIIHALIGFVFLSLVIWGIGYGIKESIANPDLGKKVLVTVGVVSLVTLISLSLMAVFVMVF